MGIYTKVPCAHCGNIFTDEDDVVVCPICGAPHHRRCYLELGHCALEEKNHADGTAWENPLKANLETQASCPKCGAEHPKGAMFCPTCGTNLRDHAAESYSSTAEDSSPHNISDVNAQRAAHSSSSSAHNQNHYGAPDAPQTPQNVLPTPVGPITPDEEFSSVHAIEIAAYIGPNSRKYLTSFKIMKESGRDFGFNWSALIFNYCFFFYRKMYKPAIVLLALVAIMSVPRLFYSAEMAKYYFNEVMKLPIAYDLELITSLESVVRTINMVQFAMSMMIAIFTNKIYYNHVISEILKIRETLPPGTSRDEYMTILARSGRVNSTLGYGAVALSLIVLFGVSFMISMNIAGQYI